MHFYTNTNWLIVIIVYITNDQVVVNQKQLFSKKNKLGSLIAELKAHSYIIT